MINQENKDALFDDRNLGGKMYAEMLIGGAAQLRANAEEVNNLNVFPVPDGDTGDNMSMTMEGGVAALRSFESENIAEVAAKISQGMLLGARGNSGVILSQFFDGIAKGFAECESADVRTIAKALEMGVKQAYAAVMTPTEGTILTVARESVEFATSRVNDDSTVRDIFSDLLKEMYTSLQHTPELLPQLKEAGVVDSGGAGLFYVMQGCYKILLGEEIEGGSELPAPKTNDIDFSKFGPDSEMVYGYCTELLLQLQNAKCDIEAFDERIIKDFLIEVGDSVVAFKTGSIIKIHVHTKTPDKVLEFCRRYGEFLTVKIENMSVQHSELSDDGKPKKPRIKKEFGTVAVASGEGIDQLFTDLGVDFIVQGGQTQNPSANDFLEAFKEVGANHIFVFPNNGNIIMAAKQAAQLYDSGEIHVIESKDLGMGYAAISAMNFQSGNIERITETFVEAMSTVSTGFISPAVRDAEIDGVQIKEGDFIGFVGKSMKVSCVDMIESATNLLDTMLKDEAYIITAFIGKDAAHDDVAALEEWVSTEYPDVEFYTVDGGQDVYPFIFVVE